MASESVPAGEEAEAPPEAPSESTTAGAESEEVQLTQTYTDPQTGLSFGVPDQWAAYPVEDAVVAMISPQNGEEDFFRENVLVTADEQFADRTLERYVEALNAEVRARYPDTETLESGDTTVAGLPARWLVDKFTGPKGETRVYRVVLVREQVAYVFHGTAPVWSFDKYRSVFEAMAQSIHWGEPEAEATEVETPPAAEPGA